MRPLFIQPVDVWMFRDGKAFSAGSDHHARSLFPPLPSVIQGAFRSHDLVQSNTSLGDVKAIVDRVGTATDYKDLRLRGPFVRSRDMLYFALPADVVAIEKNGNRFKPLMPGPKHSDDVIGNAAELEQILLPPDNIEPQKFRPGYVVQSEFEKYLTGQDFVQTPADQLFVSETRPGNAVDTGKQVTREGMLFLVDFIRPLAGVGLHVDLAAGLAELQANGMLRLGGEGHVGKFDEKPLAKPLALPHIGEQHHAGKRFKVVFLTPGYFSAGWQPNSWDTHFVGGKVKCVCAALQRYISVGGFDLTQPKMGHKPALRYVDAGSVYFFEIVEGTPQLKNDWLCDSSPDSATLGQIGFGQVAIGNW